MSFAWATVALIVLLLPGFLFAYGLYLPDRISREIVSRDPASSLASAVLVAFAIHGIGYCLLADRIDLTSTFAVLQLQQAQSVDVQRLVRTLHDSRGAVVLYVLGTNTLGLALGASLGWLQGFPPESRLGRIAGGLLRKQNRWAYELLPKKGQQAYVYAYVLSHVRQDDRVLMYRGLLENFGLTKEGRFTYLVLREPSRYYMHLEPEGPRTTEAQLWRRIGETHVAKGSDLGTLLVLEGEDIANAVFRRERVRATGADLEELYRRWTPEAIDQSLQQTLEKLSETVAPQTTRQPAKPESGEPPAH